MADKLELGIAGTLIPAIKSQKPAKEQEYVPMTAEAITILKEGLASANRGEISEWTDRVRYEDIYGDDEEDNGRE
jgi:hypothetical protein